MELSTRLKTKFLKSFYGFANESCLTSLVAYRILLHDGTSDKECFNIEQLFDSKIYWLVVWWEAKVTTETLPAAICCTTIQLSVSPGSSLVNTNVLHEFLDNLRH